MSKEYMENDDDELTQELYAAPLDAAWFPCGAFRVCCIAVLLGDFAIITRVGVHDNTNHAKLLCALDLQPAEDAAILGQGNLAFQVDVCCF
jgi:hypothetical protein